MSQTAPAPEVRRLLITHDLWTEIDRHCPPDGLENGGKALGRIYTDGIAVACLHIGPGPRAQRHRASFRPDPGYQQACHDGLLQRYPRTRLTLDYHLHPDGPPCLSAIDHQTIHSMLGPEGWGISSLVFMVLTRGPAGLTPHAFYASRQSDLPELLLRPVEVALISDDDPRVDQLLAPLPRRLRAIVPSETVLELRHQLRSIDDHAIDDHAIDDHAIDNQGIDLYGYQRLEEGLVLALSTTQVLDTYRIGRAFAAGTGTPPVTEREFRLAVFPDGNLEASFQFGGLLLDCDLDHPTLLAELPRRNEGLVDASALQRRHVAFVGLGSVGAPLAVALSQAGVGRFTLIDPDVFSAGNVARHPGDVRDLGRRKDLLLRERLLARSPSAQVECLDLDVRETRHAAGLEAVLAGADLLVISTDDPTANLAANRLAITLQVPALFVGVYEGGIGGEIFALRPPQAGCYNCVAGFRATLPPVPRAARAHDYLNLRPGSDLPPLNALGIDIAHTVSIAASAALGMVDAGDRLEGLLTPDAPLLFVANGRPGWIFTRPFELIPARIEDVGCPICRPETAIDTGPFPCPPEARGTTDSLWSEPESDGHRMDAGLYALEDGQFREDDALFPLQEHPHETQPDSTGLDVPDLLGLARKAADGRAALSGGTLRRLVGWFGRKPTAPGLELSEDEVSCRLDPGPPVLEHPPPPPLLFRGEGRRLSTADASSIKGPQLDGRSWK